MSIIQGSSTNPVAVPVQPGQNPLIDSATQNTRVQLANDLSPMDAALAVGIQGQKASPTFAFFDRGPGGKNIAVLLMAGAALYYFYLRRR